MQTEMQTEMTKEAALQKAMEFLADEADEEAKKAKARPPAVIFGQNGEEIDEWTITDLMSRVQHVQRAFALNDLKFEFTDNAFRAYQVDRFPHYLFMTNEHEDAFIGGVDTLLGRVLRERDEFPPGTFDGRLARTVIWQAKPSEKPGSKSKGR